MFGQSDNSNQAQTNSPDLAGTAPANPFGDNNAPVPAPPSSWPPNSSSPKPAVEPVVSPPAASATAPPAASGDLLGIKQQALQSLQPLVNHLDQSPEEKFKTTMMLIQA